MGHPEDRSKLDHDELIRHFSHDKGLEKYESEVEDNIRNRIDDLNDCISGDFVTYLTSDPCPVYLSLDSTGSLLAPGLLLRGSH